MPAIRAPRSLARSPAGTGEGRVLARTPANGPAASRSSRRSVRCHLSTFPVVVGEYGPVSLAVMPCSRQTRSNSTSAGRGLVNRPVNCLPLSVSTSDGTP